MAEHFQQLKQSFLNLFGVLNCCKNSAGRTKQGYEDEPNNKNRSVQDESRNLFNVEARGLRGPHRPGMPKGPSPQHT